MNTVCCDHEHHWWRYTKDAWQVRLLCKPLLRTRDRARAERSRFVWDMGYQGTKPCPTLSLLGILHGLFGIVLFIED